MFVSRDGTVTGSVDVSKLDEIEPKTDEARAQLEALKAEVQAGQEQAARDAERLAQLAETQAAQLRDDEDASDERQADAKRGETKQADEARQAEETLRLQAEAEAAGVTVDKRWGADRLRQEIEQARTKTGKQR